MVEREAQGAGGIGCRQRHGVIGLINPNSIVSSTNVMVGAARHVAPGPRLKAWPSQAGPPANQSGEVDSASSGS